SLKEIVRQNTVAVERKVLAQVLKYTGGNKAKAARLLKIDYKTMHTKVNQLGINT
ncbi:MAG: sigma-54-dependent Fis family transcriptional regulator, partial [Deltaproteobacteria bacterium]|nr:sigma-54-dependent Fis family transcriptional regulator [Deltaproteobacteria bacterium]